MINVPASSLSGFYSDDVLVTASGTATSPFIVSLPYKLIVPSGVTLTINSSGNTIINSLTGDAGSTVIVESRLPSDTPMNVTFRGTMSGFYGNLRIYDTFSTLYLYSRPLPGSSTVLFETVAPVGSGTLYIGRNRGRIAVSVEMQQGGFGAIVPLSNVVFGGYVYLGTGMTLGIAYAVKMGQPGSSDPYTGNNPVEINGAASASLGISTSVTRRNAVATKVDFYGTVEFDGRGARWVSYLSLDAKSGGSVIEENEPFGASVKINVSSGGRFNNRSNISSPLTIAGNGGDGLGALLGSRVDEAGGPAYIGLLALSAPSVIGYSSNFYEYVFTNAIDCKNFSLVLRPPPSNQPQTDPAYPAMFFDRGVSNCDSLRINELSGVGVGEVRLNFPSYSTTRTTIIQAGRVVPYAPYSFGTGTVATLDVGDQLVTTYDAADRPSAKRFYPNLILRSGSKMSIAGRTL